MATPQATKKITLGPQRTKMLAPGQGKADDTPETATIKSAAAVLDKKNATAAAVVADASPASSVVAVKESKATGPEHSLMHKWTLHYDSGTGKGEWGANIKPVATVQTVEEFWRLYNNVIRPQLLGSKATFNFFKFGVKPMYEDIYNKQGGMWTLQFPGKEPISAGRLNKCWLFTLLTMIGEDGVGLDDIAGAVVAKKRFGARIQVWTRSYQDAEKVQAIGKAWLKNMDVKDLKVVYTAHYSSKKESLFTVKPADLL
jgi:translation initiation factor 4E